ncbi:hypothetical protein Nepgr_024269 [Nepenthes gracilis]|uniref:Uncharacterized protein n=1 Tax=Nepenthes gracilis TaxID=150966 RepID=A0AAD3Y0B2_NEPGR|nr:hypothetical protein Nepgr_024269 [Nepenthes gracilis]
MEGQAKLTRTPSLLLRSSPTVRSSVNSFSSIEEAELQAPATASLSDDDLRKKTHSRVCSGPRSFLFFPTLVISLLSLLIFFSYFKTCEISTSEKFLLALIFIAVALFFAGKNKTFFHKSISLLKQLYDDNAKKHWFSKNRSKSVQWIIGGDSGSRREKNPKREVKEGVEIYSNGDYYEGEFHKGKCNGSGVYTYYENGRYEGDWIDGKYDGYGIESWGKGSKYRGQYRQGLRFGYGVYRFYTGDTYSGEWCNGHYHGVGFQTCKDGSCYIGEFKGGVKHGLGCYRFRNGDRYAGEYFGDKIHGFGVYHFANGHCYEGSWHEGRKKGYGMYTFRNGDTQSGEWDCGNHETRLTPQADSVLRAVQSARKAAEDAICLRRVDVQVNDAVMAANRAATAARVAAVKAVQNTIDDKSII